MAGLAPAAPWKTAKCARMEKMDNSLQLFALDASRAFGERIARHLGIPLSRHEEREFEDGEHKSRSLVNVRGKDVFVVHSLHGDHEQSGNDKLCRLLFFIGMLKDASAARVTAIVPYLAYARVDRRTEARGPVITRYVAQLFEAVGTDAVITMEVHNPAAFQNAFRCRTENLDAGKLLAEVFVPLLQDTDAIVVSPDAGGLKRAERFRQLLAHLLGKPVGMAFAEKYRRDGEVGGDLLAGDIDNKIAVIVDDLISTGHTLIRTVRACHARGAAAVHAAVTHGLFTGDAPHLLADDSLERIVITDTVPPFRLSLDSAAWRKITLLDSAALFAGTIQRMHAGESVSELFEF
jgi:ribose-phosphate pyrophosphokinase